MDLGDQDYPMDQGVDGASFHLGHSQKRKHAGHELTLPRKRARVDETEDGAGFESEPEGNDLETSSESSNQEQMATTAYNSVTSWLRKVMKLPQTVMKDQPRPVDPGKSSQHSLELGGTIANGTSSPRSTSPLPSRSHRGSDLQSSEEHSFLQPTGSSKAYANARIIIGEMDTSPSDALTAHTNEDLEIVTESQQQSASLQSSCEPGHVDSQIQKDHPQTIDDIEEVTNISVQATPPYNAEKHGKFRIMEPPTIFTSPETVIPHTASSQNSGTVAGSHEQREFRPEIQEQLAAAQLATATQVSEKAEDHPITTEDAVKVQDENIHRTSPVFNASHKSEIQTGLQSAIYKEDVSTSPVPAAARPTSIEDSEVHAELHDQSLVQSSASIPGPSGPEMQEDHLMMTSDSTKAFNTNTADALPVFKVSQGGKIRMGLPQVDYKKAVSVPPLPLLPRPALTEGSEVGQELNDLFAPPLLSTSNPGGPEVQEDHATMTDDALEPLNTNNSNPSPLFKVSQSGEIRIGLPPSIRLQAVSALSRSAPTEDSEMRQESYEQPAASRPPSTPPRGASEKQEDHPMMDDDAAERPDGSTQGTSPPFRLSESGKIRLGLPQVNYEQAVSVPPLPLLPRPALTEGSEMGQEFRNLFAPPLLSTSNPGGPKVQEDHTMMNDDALEPPNTNTSNPSPLFKASRRDKIRIGLPPSIRLQAVSALSRSAPTEDSEMRQESYEQPAASRPPSTPPRGASEKQDHPMVDDDAAERPDGSTQGTSPPFRLSESGKIRLGLLQVNYEQAVSVSPLSVLSRPASTEDSDMGHGFHDLFSAPLLPFTPYPTGSQIQEDHPMMDHATLETLNANISSPSSLLKASQGGEIQIGLLTDVNKQAASVSPSPILPRPASTEDSEMSQELHNQSGASLLSSTSPPAGSQTTEDHFMIIDDANSITRESSPPSKISQDGEVHVGLPPDLNKQAASVSPPPVYPHPALTEDSEMGQEWHNQFAPSLLSASSPVGPEVQDHSTMADDALKPPKPLTPYLSHPFKLLQSHQNRIELPSAVNKQAICMSPPPVFRRPTSTEDSGMSQESHNQSGTPFLSSISPRVGLQTVENHFMTVDDSTELPDSSIRKSSPPSNVSQGGEIQIGLPPAANTRAVSVSPLPAIPHVASTRDSEMQPEFHDLSAVPSAFSTLAPGSPQIQEDHPMLSDDTTQVKGARISHLFPHFQASRSGNIRVRVPSAIHGQAIFMSYPPVLPAPTENSEIRPGSYEQPLVPSLSIPGPAGSQIYESHTVMTDNATKPSHANTPPLLFEPSQSSTIRMRLPRVHYQKAVSVPPLPLLPRPALTEGSEMGQELHDLFAPPLLSTSNPGGPKVQEDHTMMNDDALEPPNTNTSNPSPLFKASRRDKIRIGLPPSIRLQAVSALSRSAPTEDSEMRQESYEQPATSRSPFTPPRGASETQEDHPMTNNDVAESPDGSTQGTSPPFRLSESGKIRLGLPQVNYEKAVSGSLTTAVVPCPGLSKHADLTLETNQPTVVLPLFQIPPPGGSQTTEDQLMMTDDAVGPPNSITRESSPSKASQDGEFQTGLPPDLNKQAASASPLPVYPRPALTEDSEMGPELNDLFAPPLLSTSSPGGPEVQEDYPMINDNALEPPHTNTLNPFPLFKVSQSGEIRIGLPPSIHPQAVPVSPPPYLSCSTSTEDSTYEQPTASRSPFTPPRGASEKQEDHPMMDDDAAERPDGSTQGTSPPFRLSESGKIRLGLPQVNYEQAVSVSPLSVLSRPASTEDSEMRQELHDQFAPSFLSTSRPSVPEVQEDHFMINDNALEPPNTNTSNPFPLFKASQSGEIRIGLPPSIHPQPVSASPLSVIPRSTPTEDSEMRLESYQQSAASHPSATPLHGGSEKQDRPMITDDAFEHPDRNTPDITPRFKLTESGEIRLGLPHVDYEKAASASPTLVIPLLPSTDDSETRSQTNQQPVLPHYKQAVFMSHPPAAPRSASREHSTAMPIHPHDQSFATPSLPPTQVRIGHRPHQHYPLLPAVDPSARSAHLQMNFLPWPEHALNQLNTFPSPTHFPASQLFSINVASQPLINISDTPPATTLSHPPPVSSNSDNGSDIYMPVTTPQPPNSTTPVSGPSRKTGIRLPLPSIPQYSITDRVPVMTPSDSWNNQPRVIYVNGNRPPNSVATTGVEMRRRLHRHSREWDDPILPEPNFDDGDDERESDDDNDNAQFPSRSPNRRPSLDFDVGNEEEDHADNADPPSSTQNFRDPRLDRPATLRDVMDLRCCHKNLNANDPSSDDDTNEQETLHRRKKKKKSSISNAWNREIRKFAAKLMKRSPLPGHYSLKGAAVTSVGLSRLKKYFQTQNPADGPSADTFELSLDDAIVKNHKKESNLWNARAVIVFSDAFINDNPEVDREAVQKTFKTHIKTLEDHFRVSLQDDSDIAEDKITAATEQRKRSRCYRRSYLHKIIPQLKEHEVLEDLPISVCSGDEYDADSGKLYITTLPWRSQAVGPYMDVLEKVHLSMRFPDGQHPTTGSFPLQRINPPSPIIDDKAPVAIGLPENFYDPEWLALQPEYRRVTLKIKPPMDLKFDDQVLDMARRAANIVGPGTPPEPPTWL